MGQSSRGRIYDDFKYRILRYMTETSISELELVADICRQSLFESVKEFWPLIIPEKPVWNWHIEYICDEVQSIVERVIAGKPKKHDLVINVPPGSTKSTIISVVVPIWAWMRMPSFRTIVATHTYTPLGLNLSRLSRQIVRSDLYGEAFGLPLTEDQDTKGYFVNVEGGSRLTVTVAGHSPTGMHAHLLIVDDPIDPKSARKLSQIEINEANRWLSEDLQSRKVDKQVVPMILFMQRLKENDPTGFWLDHGGDVKHICLPATSDEGYEVKPKALKKRYKNGLLDPVRMTRKFLMQEKIRNEWSYAAQYGQKPTPPGGSIFRVDKLIQNIADPPEIIKRAVRSWDKASTKQGGARTAGVKMCEDDKKRIWILNVVKGQWAVDERDEHIAQTAAIDGVGVPITMEQEGGSAGVFEAQYAVRALAGYVVETPRPTGDKTVRAMPFASQVNAGRVWLVRGDWNHDYIEELRHFPNGTFKDQVDGSSQAFKYLFNVDASLEEWLDSENMF